MNTYSDLAQQLYLVRSLSEQGFLTQRAKALLKGLVLAGDEKINQICSAAATESLQNTADRLFERAVEHAESTFEQVFSDISVEDARQLSTSSRSEDALSSNGDFTYGEINFRSFAAVLRDVHTTRGSRLLDLGAGIGKPVIAAALLFDFQACVGIEQLRGLYKVACSRPKRLLRVLQAQGGLPEDLPDMEFSNTSFFDTSWRDYDVVFLSSTTFVPATLAAVAAKARELPHGAIVISLTHSLQAPHLQEQSRRTVDMSWGPTKVIVHRRVPTGQPPPVPPSYAAALSDTESDGAARSSGGGTGHALPAAPPARGMRVRVPSYASSDSMGLFDVERCERDPPSEVDVMADINEGGTAGSSKPPLPPHASAAHPGGRALLKKSFSMSSQGTATLEGVDDRVSPPSTPTRSRSHSDTGAAASAAPFGSPAGGRHARVGGEYGGVSSPQAEGLLQRRHAKRAVAQGSRLGGSLRHAQGEGVPRASPLFAPTGGAIGMPPFHMGGEGGARGLSSPMDRSLRQRNAQRHAAGPLRDRQDSSGSAEGPLHKTYVTPPKPASAAASGTAPLPGASSPQGTRLLQQRAARQAALPRGSLLQHSAAAGSTPSRTTYSDSNVTPPQPASLTVPPQEDGDRGLSSPMDRSLRQRNAQRQVAGPLRDRLDSATSQSSGESAGGNWQAAPPVQADSSADLREDVSSPFGARLRRSRGGAPPPSRALGDPRAGGSASPLTGATPAPAMSQRDQQHLTPPRDAGGVQGGASSPMGRSLLQARNAGSMPRGGPLKMHMRDANGASPQHGAAAAGSPPPQVRLSQHNKYLQSVAEQHSYEGSASPQGDALMRRRQMAHTMASGPVSAPPTGPLFSMSRSGDSTPASSGFVSEGPSSGHGPGHASAFAVSPAGSDGAGGGGALPRNVSAFAVDEDSGGAGGYPSSRNDTTLSMDEEADIVTSLGAGGGAQMRVGVRTRYSDADNGVLEGSL